MIFHSFKKTGKSVKLDNSERGLINISDQLIDPDNLLIQNFNINEYIQLRNTFSKKRIEHTQKRIYDYFDQNNNEIDLD